MDSVSRYIVIGGGEWGSHHVERLYWAMSTGRMDQAPVIAVDRDPGCRAARLYSGRSGFELIVREWVPFLTASIALEPAGGDSVVVPSPYQPHLFLDWLEGSLRAASATARLERWAVPADLGLPYQYAGAGSCLYISAADWVCPKSCREPAVCPATRLSRTWELESLLEERCAEGVGKLLPVIWRSHYICPGVAGVAASELRRGVQRIQGARRGRALVATVSFCHGAVAGLQFDLAPEATHDD